MRKGFELRIRCDKELVEKFLMKIHAYRKASGFNPMETVDTTFYVDGNDFCMFIPFGQNRGKNTNKLHAFLYKTMGGQIAPIAVKFDNSDMLRRYKANLFLLNCHTSPLNPNDFEEFYAFAESHDIQLPNSFSESCSNNTKFHAQCQKCVG